MAMLTSTRRRSLVSPPYGAPGVASTIQLPYSGRHAEAIGLHAGAQAREKAQDDKRGVEN